MVAAADHVISSFIELIKLPVLEVNMITMCDVWLNHRLNPVSLTSRTMTRCTVFQSQSMAVCLEVGPMHGVLMLDDLMHGDPLPGVLMHGGQMYELTDVLLNMFNGCSNGSMTKAFNIDNNIYLN